jgi:hypothetical protein
MAWPDPMEARRPWRWLEFRVWAKGRGDLVQLRQVPLCQASRVWVPGRCQLMALWAHVEEVHPGIFGALRDLCRDLRISGITVLFIICAPGQRRNARS